MAYDKDYYQAHREAHIAAVRAYRARNIEWYKAYMASYKAEHKEELNEYLNGWKSEHPLNVKLNSMADCDKNFQRYRDYSREYQAEHPESVKEGAKKYRDKPENKARHKLLKESLRLVEEGVIPKTNCSCGSNEGLRLFHRDYSDPMNVEFQCKECFWRNTKIRNRQAKIERLSE
jgi:hypothetical protein